MISELDKAPIIVDAAYCTVFVVRPLRRRLYSSGGGSGRSGSGSRVTITHSTLHTCTFSTHRSSAAAHHRANPRPMARHRCVGSVRRLLVCCYPESWMWGLEDCATALPGLWGPCATLDAAICASILLQRRLQTVSTSTRTSAWASTVYSLILVCRKCDVLQAAATPRCSRS